MRNKEKNQEKVWVPVTVKTMQEKYDDYKYFMDEFAPRLVGDKEYRSKCCENPPETWLCPALETFGLVTFENYLEVATKEARNEEGGGMGKFTQSVSAKRNGGYKTEGLERYKVLYAEVKESRSKRMDFGNKYLEQKREQFAAKEAKSKKRKADSVADREKNAVEMPSDDQYDF